MFRFKDSVVLITGASSGIGAALAREFAEKGARLVLTARRKDNLEKLAGELRLKGTETLVCQCDVTKDGEVERAVRETVRQFGKLDVVIANAGFGVVGRVEKLTIQDYDRQFETNVYGVLRTVYASLGELKKTRGRLALVGSVTGFVSLPGNSPYTMSKHAVKGLSYALYHELKREGVSVTHIAPGFVQSEIRRVDNSGNYHAHAKEPLPMWLQMSAETAARKILRAIYCRRRERILTGHGYWAVFIATRFPNLFAFLINLFGITSRSQPKLAQ